MKMAKQIAKGIYKITNKVNGKIYIGQSSNLIGRWVKHKNFLKNDNHHNRHLQAAWNKYGEDNFIFEVIEECDIDELDDKENYWINYYDSYHNGYNLDYGGKGIRGYKHTSAEINKMRRIQNTPIILQFDLNFNFVKRWIGGATHISKELHITRQSIVSRCRHIMRGEMSPYKGYYWVYEAEYESDNFSWDKYLNNIPAIKVSSLYKFKMTKNIVQYDRNFSLIRVWDSLNGLMDEGYDIDRIRIICNKKGNFKTHHDYIWAYEGYDFSDGYFDDIKYYYNNPRKNGREKPVCKLDDIGNIISTYSSLTEASNELNPNRDMTSNIHYAIKNNGVCYGYHWNYLQ